MNDEHQDRGGIYLGDQRTSHRHELAIDHDGAVVRVDRGHGSKVDIWFTARHVDVRREAVGRSDFVAALRRIATTQQAGLGDLARSVTIAADKVVSVAT